MKYFFALVAAAIFMVSPAVAFVPDGSVEVPIGEWIGQLVTLFGMGIAAFITMRLNAWIDRTFDKDSAQRLREYTESAIQYGINATPGAVKDMRFKVDVGNEVVERALEYGVRLFPDLIEKFGGIEAERQRIQARIDFDANVAVPAPRQAAESFVEDNSRTRLNKDNSEAT